MWVGGVELEVWVRVGGERFVGMVVGSGSVWGVDGGGVWVVEVKGIVVKRVRERGLDLWWVDRW